MSWPGPVTPEEPLARFLYSSGWFSRQNSIVKQAAFLPDRQQRLSVFRSCEMTETALWQLGNQDPSGRNLHGAGIITAGAVEQTSLHLDPNDVPPRHTNVIGWPAGKDEQKSLALQLSSEAKLVLRNDYSANS